MIAKVTGTMMMAALAIGLAGCDSLDQLALESGEAGFRTAVDLSVTAFFNQVVGNREQPETPPEDTTGGDTGGDGGGGDGGGGDGAGGDPAAAGETVFAANNCAVCHCADAGGGCALDAPSLVGVEAARLDEMLRGAGAHPGGKFDLGDQDIGDLEAYLSSV